MHPYMPHTDQDINLMLSKIGVDTIEALFRDIPDEIMLSRSLDLPQMHSEQGIIKRLTTLSKKNMDTSDWLRFVGGGLYEHRIPSIIPQLLSRSEFNTAYTPYQPEIAQGTLQAIFEYQTMITELTGLEVANASHYDGATALAEAAFMACASTKRNKILIADTLNQESLAVVKTYLKYKDLSYELVPSIGGRVSCEALSSCLTDEVAGYIVATPNAYGLLEDLTGVSDLLHNQKSLLITSTNPMSLALFKSPGEWGADIAVGDAQVFGNAINMGGPSLGFITCTKKLLRKMPGRIVGETLDLDGKRGYVLTLQAREQHIRREKATSNITSNQALNALAATIYLSTLGLEGIREVSHRSRINAHYLQDQLTKINGINLAYRAPFYNEFVVEVEELNTFVDAMASYQIIPGIPLDDHRLLVTSTEVHDLEALDRYIQLAGEVMAS